MQTINEYKINPIFMCGIVIGYVYASTHGELSVIMSVNNICLNELNMIYGSYDNTECCTWISLSICAEILWTIWESTGQYEFQRRL